jgi:hypothetical protein
VRRIVRFHDRALIQADLAVTVHRAVHDRGSARAVLAVVPVTQDAGADVVRHPADSSCLVVVMDSLAA